MSVLCLKNEQVLKIKDIDGRPSELIEVINPELLPLCLKDNCTTESLNEWLGKRRIPDNREGLEAVNERFGTEWREKNINYLSLSDHYWIKRREEKWKAINFFTNRYSPDVGNMFFSPWKINNSRFGASPDLSCGGVLMKCWRQNNDRTSYLVKAGSQIAHQEPLSEVLVSVFCEKLKKIPCVKYDLCVEGIVMCSRCDNFVTVDTDFVPASHIYVHEKRNDSDTVLAHLIKMCEFYNIPDAESFLKWLIFVDRSTGNMDRNLNNIGFLRDLKTMKFIGPAPLFDSGNAYWDTSFVDKAKTSKCFADNEKEVFNEMKKKVDLSILDDTSYEAIILKYPEITDQYKEKLIKAISKKNAQILGKEKDVSIER